MKKAAVIGHPIAHSLSPVLHGTWLEQLGIEGTYEAIDIHPDHLEQEVRRLFDEGYAGFNVTIPHKSNIINILDRVSPEAQALGAVNTVVNRNGTIYGYNSDTYGFIRNIEVAYPEFPFQGTALILGAGGAARAAVQSLQQQGMQILLSNRTAMRGFELQQDFPGIELVDWADKENCLSEVILVVNTTSLGMAGKPDLEMSLDQMAPNTLVYDIVYNPIETTLLKNAKDRECYTLDGLGMLIHQAVMGFEMWFGGTPEITDDLRHKLLEKIL